MCTCREYVFTCTCTNVCSLDMPCCVGMTYELSIQIPDLYGLSLVRHSLFHCGCQCQKLTLCSGRAFSFLPRRDGTPRFPRVGFAPGLGMDFLYAPNPKFRSPEILAKKSANKCMRSNCFDGPRVFQWNPCEHTYTYRICIYIYIHIANVMSPIASQG